MISGVLFLTAGYGTRAEPLSIARPKCLLPWRESTILESLVKQFLVLEPELIAVNASRCPEMIRDAVTRVWDGRLELLFEERPLGASGTLARNAELLQGTWILCNTDFSMDLPVCELVQGHGDSDSSWTVLTGPLPREGEYGTLDVDGSHRHYLGVSVIPGEVAAAAAEEQLSEGLFTALRSAAEKRGIRLREHYCSGEWLDLGEVEMFRKHTLALGSYVHSQALVDPDARLEGCCYIGPGCIIHGGALVRNSVLLEGSHVLAGAEAVDCVLPYHFIKES